MVNFRRKIGRQWRLGDSEEKRVAPRGRQSLHLSSDPRLPVLLQKPDGRLIANKVFFPVMPQPPKQSTYIKVLAEANQDHTTRKHLYPKIEAQLGANGAKKRLVCFFTTFQWPVQLENRDAEMMEEVLQNCCPGDKELVLAINCPGGDALAAERMVNVCR